MTSILTFLMLIAGGIALVIQNTLMARITHSASTVLIALVLNSAVGLVLLISLLAGKSGSSGFYELLLSFKGWMLLPGILGSFFVFTGITGYQNIGASRTIAILVASQLVAGLGYDIYRSGTESLLKNLPAIIGAVFLVAGAFLVASRKF
jgi:bacterial/archaeal transporter family-2 protein